MSLNDAIDAVSREVAAYAQTLDAESARYWLAHEDRFRYTTQLVGRLLERRSRAGRPVARVLDIGNSYQTLMFARLWPQLQLDTLGFLDDRYAPGGATTHHPFDLNDAGHPGRQLRLEDARRYDLILLLEVIEHLYTAPQLVLRFLASLLRPGGHIVIQTPNAAALLKRLRLLLGLHPYELIRENPTNPGHFREYTRSELAAIAAASGFVVEELHMMHYFAETRAQKVARAVARVLPGSFRAGMTLVLRMP